MFLSVGILGRFTTENHAMALLRQGPTRRHHLHHSPGRSPWTAPGPPENYMDAVEALHAIVDSVAERRPGIDPPGKVDDDPET